MFLPAQRTPDWGLGVKLLGLNCWGLGVKVLGLGVKLLGARVELLGPMG